MAVGNGSFTDQLIEGGTKLYNQASSAFNDISKEITTGINGFSLSGMVDKGISMGTNALMNIGTGLIGKALGIGKAILKPFSAFTNATKELVTKIQNPIPDNVRLLGENTLQNFLGSGFGNANISGGFNMSFAQRLTSDPLILQTRTPVKGLFEPSIRPTLQYPEDLDNVHYMIFQPQRRTKVPEGNEFVGLKYETKQSIVLPIPGQIRDERGLIYNNESLGVLGGIGAGQVNPLKAGKDLLSFVDTGLNDIVNMQVTNGDPKLSLIQKGMKESIVGLGGIGFLMSMTKSGRSKLKSLGGIAGGATVYKVAKGYMFAKGVAINPRMSTQFEGVQFREFQFSYRFMPRSETESNTVKRIVEAFQEYAAPDYYAAEAGESSFSGFTYPDEFYLSFSDTLKPGLFEFLPCVLKNVSVSYNTDGQAFFEGTNAPLMIDLALHFQETKLITRGQKYPNVSGMYQQNDADQGYMVGE